MGRTSTLALLLVVAAVTLSTGRLASSKDLTPKMIGPLIGVHVSVNGSAGAQKLSKSIPALGKWASTRWSSRWTTTSRLPLIRN